MVSVSVYVFWIVVCTCQTSWRWINFKANSVGTGLHHSLCRGTRPPQNSASGRSSRSDTDASSPKPTSKHALHQSVCASNAAGVHCGSQLVAAAANCDAMANLLTVANVNLHQENSSSPAMHVMHVDAPVTADLLFSLLHGREPSSNSVGYVQATSAVEGMCMQQNSILDDDDESTDQTIESIHYDAWDSSILQFLDIRDIFRLCSVSRRIRSLLMTEGTFRLICVVSA